MIILNLKLIEKDKQPSRKILNLFEKVRVAYLSARADPSEYGGKWRNAVKLIEDMSDDLDSAAKEMKEYVSVKDLGEKEVRNPESDDAKKLFESVKLLRYASDLVEDPFAKRFKYEVLEELLSNPESMIKFVHYALRADDKALPDEVYDIKDMTPGS